MTISEFEADTKIGQGQGHVEARTTTKSRVGVGLADLSSYSNASHQRRINLSIITDYN